MTRRLTISILLTLWAILIAGGGVAYVATRSILLEDLDNSLLVQALATAKASYPGDYPELPAGSDMRVYLLESRKALSPGRNVPPPAVRHVAFTSNDMRTMTVWVYYSPTAYHEIMVSLPTQRFSSYLRRLAIVLAAFVLATGAIVALVAGGIARGALKPLTLTARTIGSIDERRLDRRIDAEGLPTELRPMAERLNDMLARLEASFSARRQFLSDASHELRTPVAALVTSLEVTLNRPRSTEQYVAAIEQALADAQYLQQLAEGLLETARAQRDDAPEPEPVDITTLVSGCCDMVEPLAQERGLTLHRQVAPSLAAPLDDRRLRSILINLLSNAIDYNRPGGSVTVSAALRDDAGNPTIEVAVEDTGVGIAPQHLPRIFEPFYRVDESRTSQPAPGSGARPMAAHLGLGLALAKRHAEALGGSLDVRSVPGEGTTFSLRVPCGHQPPTGPRTKRTVEYS